MWIPSAFLWLLLPGSSMVELPGMGNQHPFSLWALVPNFARVFNTQTQPGWTPGRQIPQFVSKIDQGANASLEKEQGACPHWFLVMQTFQEWTRFQSSGHKMMMIIDNLEARKKEDTRRCWEICSVSAFQDNFYILLVSYHSFTSLELWSSIQQPLALGPWPLALRLATGAPGEHSADDADFAKAVGLRPNRNESDPIGIRSAQERCPAHRMTNFWRKRHHQVLSLE